MPEKKTNIGEVSFVLHALIKWVIAAIPVLIAAALILSVAAADGTAFGYVSSAVSFIAAAAAGSAAFHKRGKGGLGTGLIVGVVITTFLLMIGFVMEGSELAPDGVISVAAFTISGCAVGSILPRRKGNSKRNRRGRVTLPKLT